MGTVYLICFEKPFKHATHYIGYTKDLKKRLAYHRQGRGSCLLNALNKAGIGYEVTRTWNADGNFERKLHNRKGSKALCPKCNPLTAMNRGTK